ncbi:hypothetical protein [Chachezhania antarctica]|uniref:hypothetical protein n=1 Tax=Chachezhania antarctica TaxID=2340860 RepID=UPI0013CED8CE|nr:hypothetical protein [Chachezhania antarctica]
MKDIEKTGCYGGAPNTNCATAAKNDRKRQLRAQNGWSMVYHKIRAASQIALMTGRPEA